MPTAPLILVVEDEFQVRFVIAEFLESRGYRLALANERSVAETFLRNSRPALVIADVVLRGGGGLDLAREAQSMGVPVLLISGEPQAMEKYQSGPFPFLHKPFRLGDLDREVSRLLGSQSTLCR
jgi:two-component system OmpR family response regulator